jgi:hypothetical protein
VKKRSKKWPIIGANIVLVLACILALLFIFQRKQAANADQTSTGMFAPYVDTGLYNPPFSSLADASQQSGTKFFTLAFITASGCSPKWDGVTAITAADDPTQKSIGANIQSNIQAIRQAGGDVIISFGGASGQDLAQDCPDVTSLEQQYQAVVNTYQATYLDFDIEGAASADTASIDRRDKALAALQAQAQQSGKQLYINFTLPVEPSGLTQDGLNIIQNAISDGVNINVVNGMAMDYGSGAGSDPNPAPGKMGDMAVQVAQSLHDQLKTLYPDKTDSQLWSMVGVTPMIGQNDNSQETFTLADAQELTTFAQQNHLGLLSMWSLTRDIPCGGNATSLSQCSMVSQQPFDYAKVFSQFSSGSTTNTSSLVSVGATTPSPTPDPTSSPTSTSTPMPTPTPSPTSTSTAQGSIQPWTVDNNHLYQPGDEVTYQGHTYICLRQIWGEAQWTPDAPGIVNVFWQQTGN